MIAKVILHANLLASIGHESACSRNDTIGWDLHACASRYLIPKMGGIRVKLS